MGFVTFMFVKDGTIHWKTREWKKKKKKKIPCCKEKKMRLFSNWNKYPLSKYSNQLKWRQECDGFSWLFNKTSLLCYEVQHENTFCKICSS